MKQKNCSSCSQWTNWQQNAHDTCTHCGAILDERKIVEEIAWKQRDADYEKDNWLKPNESDGPVKAFFRRIGFVLHLVFGAIAWFFIWAFMATPA